MRQDQFLVTATLDGKPLGRWDKHDGGEITASETKYKPGGMDLEQTLGGSTSVANVTITRRYIPERDHDLFRATIAPRVGKGKMAVAVQILDVDGVPYGKAHVYHGVLMSAKPPESDSNSNAAGLFVLVMSTNGDVG